MVELWLLAVFVILKNRIKSSIKTPNFLITLHLQNKTEISIMKYSVLFFLLLSFIKEVGAQDKYFEIIKNVELFTNVYKELNEEFVDEIDPSELMRTGIDAMVGSLDPFTNFITSSQYERYRIERQGKYEGIGIIVRYVDGLVTVAELAEGGPAQKAGLVVGDQIVSINNESVRNKKAEEVNQIMRGAPGSNIALKLIRPGAEDQFDLTISRDEYDVPNVPVFEMISGNIAYVKLTTFTEDAGKNVKNALVNLKKDHDVKGIILDLRYNGGGLLREAVALSNVFIEKDNHIVSTRGKVIENDRSYNTLKDAFDSSTPLAVLINNKSASASEIVSGTIQDYDRGVILGQRSYGKGLVQNYKKIGYNSQMKLTTAKYYIHSGRCIQSVKYENGEPVDIPLEKRSEFKTNNGRIVHDGGGVLPDIILDKKQESDFVSALEKQGVIFKFVTNYLLKNPKVEDEKTYTFSAYDEFVNYAKKSDFIFEKKSEAIINDLKAQLKEENLSANTEKQINGLLAVLENDKKDDFIEFKDVIIRKIEDDIITRTFFEKGKIRRNLRHDHEVQEAVKVLKDASRYAEILNLK